MSESGTEEKVTSEEEKVYRTPYCWAVRTYKHLNISPTDFTDTENVFVEMSEGDDPDIRHRDIAYGNYDRIQMIPVDTFADFTNQSYRTYSWYGSSQVMLLFPLEEESQRQFVWGHAEGEEYPRVLLKNGEKVEGLKGFFAVSFCYLSDEVRNSDQSYDDLLCCCRDSINKLVGVYNEMLEMSGDAGEPHGHVAAEVFGSFSSAEIAVIWSSRQYTDILYLIDCIRDFSFPDKISLPAEDIKKGFSMFRTTYTMLSFPDIVRGDHESDPSLSEILGRAHIQFVMQNGFGEKSFPDFRNFLEQCLKNAGTLIGEKEGTEYKVDLRRCAGEYDLLGDVESKYLPRLFSNPLNWKKVSDPTWKPKEDDPNYYFCSVHHPKFREYVQYSFTRLSYVEEDLPVFTRPVSEAAEGDKFFDDWREKLDEVSKLHDGVDIKPDEYLANWRSALIQEIRKKHSKDFEELINIVEKRIPVISNLRAELQQLFSDYVQCCCSSADYQWIEDYDEIFQQTIERIRQSILGIPVLGADLPRDSRKAAWENARESLKGIRSLMQALLQQTSHITSSGKLFFKEQDVHFGYTAQHDLVIHAYYDIIKHLIQYIYSYTDTRIQSKLYPLVNFCPEDRISSQIFTEESAEGFLSDYEETGNMQLRSRVMAIHIPLDGMDNLMHYLPMLIHEVFHYAAPEDRKKRNLTLAKIAIYQTLRRAFFQLFRSLLKKHIESEITKDSTTCRSLEKDWQESTDAVLFDVIEKKEKEIYQGLMSNFFWSEKKTDCDEKLKEEAPVLRSWFIIWLENWMSDNKKRQYTDGTAERPSESAAGYENFSDLFPCVFDALETNILEQIRRLKDKAGSGRSLPEYISIYLKVLEEMSQKLHETRDKEDAPLFQELAAFVDSYVNHGSELAKILENLDEIFPDMAMVSYSRMTPQAYMLQIALDLDSQLFNESEYYSDQMRFAPVLHWIFRRDAKADTKIKEIKCLRHALNEFKTLYIAAYKAASSTLGTSGKIKQKAESWSRTFKNIYSTYYSRQWTDSFGHIRTWTRILIDDMVHCLDLNRMPHDLRDKHRGLFVEPYQQYLEILKSRDAENETDTRKELLKLSIKTIRRFQRRQSLRYMNEEFERKHARPAIRPVKSAHIDDRVQILSPWESSLVTIEQYYSAIQYALGRLYHYRDMERIPSATGMWYRGVANASYPILPSGFVHFVEDAGRLRCDFHAGEPYYYIQAQLHNYEVFRYSVEGTSSEIDPARYYSTINYLTLMQHYLQHTNLLDWSEDSFASTYFALEDEINLNDQYSYVRKDEEKKKAALREKDNDAVLYILDPVRFNKVCSEIESGRLFTDRIRHSVKGETLRTTIPNLSIKDNQAAFDEYTNPYQHVPDVPYVTMVPGKDPDKKNVSLKDMRDHLRSDQLLDIHLPRAVYTAKMNSRIRAQSGLFVAFSLKSLPVIWEDEREDFMKPAKGPNAGLFYYQALETIQNYYLDTPGRYPFLMKVIIPAAMKEEMGRMLYRFGISKERIYPEYQNNRSR